MVRSPFPRLLLLLAALASGALPLQAQSIRSPFRYQPYAQGLSVYGGYLFTNPTVDLNDSTAAEFGPRSAPVVGVRYQLRFSGPLSGELGVGFSPTERRVYDALVNRDSTVIVPAPTGEFAGMTLLLAEAGLRFHLTGPRTWHGLAPFLLATGGVGWDLSGTDPAEEDISPGKRFDFGPGFAVGVGTGTDWFLTDRVALRAEAHARLWRLEAPEGFTPVRRTRIREWAPNTGLSLGGVFHF